jgi:ketosteroid isomerase-like protein
MSANQTPPSVVQGGMNLLVSCILMLISACAGVPDELRLAREIQAEYDQLAAAYNRADVDAILSFRLPNFETFPPSGEYQHMDAAQMRKYTQDWFDLNKPPIEVRFTVESLEVRSADEVAVKVLQWASRYQDREGKRVHVEHEVRQRETWQRTPAGWKLRMVDQIDLANRKRWIDGVPEAK